MSDEKPKLGKQLYAGLSITLGGFIVGTAIGWSSPAEEMVKAKVNVSTAQFGWMASIFTLAAAFSQIITAVLMEKMGRKWTIVTMSLLSISGWGLFMISQFWTYIGARVLLGLFAGGLCVVCPTFVGEMAHKSIRGLLGVCFQLMLTIGIFYSYLFGFIKNLFVFHAACAVPPIILTILVIFIPDTPVILYKKNKPEAGLKALIYYRGPSYNRDAEVADLEKLMKKDETSFWSAMKARACKKGLVMTLGMMVIQQLTGINAVIYYMHYIFKITKTNIPSELSACAVAIVQIVFCGIAALVVDRAGRKILWIVSLATMGICQVIVGVYFTLYRSKRELAEKIGVVPTIAICLYIAGFSLGTGPLPWSMLGELIPTRVKPVIGTTSAFVNWMLAFLVTVTFPHLPSIIGMDTICYFFGAVCFIGIVFILFCVIETKNKTLDEIQILLESKKEKTQT